MGGQVWVLGRSVWGSYNFGTELGVTPVFTILFQDWGSPTLVQIQRVGGILEQNWGVQDRTDLGPGLWGSMGSNFGLKFMGPTEGPDQFWVKIQGGRTGGAPPLHPGRPPRHQPAPTFFSDEL